MSVTLRVGIERTSSQNDNSGVGGDISSMTEEHAKAFFYEIKNILTPNQWAMLKQRVNFDGFQTIKKDFLIFNLLFAFM